jgi:hypothetical protein
MSDTEVQLDACDSIVRLLRKHMFNLQSMIPCSIHLFLGEQAKLIVQPQCVGSINTIYFGHPFEILA